MARDVVGNRGRGYPGAGYVGTAAISCPRLSSEPRFGHVPNFGNALRLITCADYTLMV